jgi:hypothetical protein
MTRALPLAAALVAVALAAPARAAASDGCAGSYERAQEHRLEGRLRAAAEQLLECAQATCPAFVRSDCTKWLDEVQAAQPTMVFVARQAGRERDDVTVTCNGQPVATRLDGRAVSVDPGKQSCRFEAEGAGPLTLPLLVLEGQKNCLVEVQLPPESRTALRAVPLVLAGVGAAGVVGFAVLGTSGLRAERRLRGSCAPTCPAGEVDSVRTRYRLADVSLGVGLLSAAVASYLYWSAPPGRAVDVAVAVGPGGAAVAVGSAF